MAPARGAIEICNERDTLDRCQLSCRNHNLALELAVKHEPNVHALQRTPGKFCDTEARKLREGTLARWKLRALFRDGVLSLHDRRLHERVMFLNVQKWVNREKEPNASPGACLAVGYR